MLSLEAVQKGYGGGSVLQPVDLVIDRGRTTAIIGPSGCGKTTLLKLMLGLLWPDAGEVRFDGQALSPRNVEALRHRIGYVIQEGGLFPHLSARGNVILLAEHLGWRRDAIERRLQDLCQLAQIEPAVLRRYPAELSGGQRQRVALMRALMPDPDVLLLDEPLAALDPMIRFQLQGELKAIFEGLGKTVVLVTHDLAEAAFFGDAIVLLRAGQIVQQGTLEDLVTRPAEAFVEDFLRAQRAGLFVGGNPGRHA